MAVSAIRTVIIYLALLVAMRLMGKRQLGDLQPIELAVTLLISDLAAVPMQEPSLPLVYGLMPMAVLVALEILLSVAMMRSSRFSRLITGTPMVVIRNGKPLVSAMRRLRLTLEDLMDSLRVQGIFDLADVDTAIVETNGKISVYPVAERRPLTAKDLHIRLPGEPIPAVIITDGVISAWGLSLCEWDNDRLMRVLSDRQVALSDVFLMTADRSGQYTLIRQEKSP